ncbi:MAG: hypothetical protein LBG19_07310 [Prevotellaceae bacterium]|jgi:ABC-type multidrug transport system fused ATPase/permease subunit|nr:hypothetical protein [Prevotellaceae bacterium]
MRRKHRIFGSFIFLAVVAALTAVVMLLWNAIIPAVIGWSVINYWQALGLMVLCRILFGGLKRPMGHHPATNGMNRREYHQFHEKLRGMSRDERRNFIRQRMAEGFCFDNKSEETPEKEAE